MPPALAHLSALTSIVLPHGAEERVHHRGSLLLHRRSNMTVEAERNSDIRMAEWNQVVIKLWTPSLITWYTASGHCVQGLWRNFLKVSGVILMMGSYPATWACIVSTLCRYEIPLSTGG